MTEQVAVITGVSSGLGRAMARQFRAQGLRVVGISRAVPDFELDLHIAADITDAARRGGLLSRIIAQFGRVDLLVNNAGKGAYETWEEMPEEHLRELFELNFFALVAMTRLFLPTLKETRGSIINISSISGAMHVPCMGAYCTSKAAVNFFSASLRAEIKNYGISVLNVMPGRINTGFSTRALGDRKSPYTPGASTPELFAAAVWNAWRRGKRQLIFPGWYTYLPLIARFFPDFYDGKNRKLWGLDKP